MTDEDNIPRVTGETDDCLTRHTQTWSDRNCLCSSCTSIVTLLINNLVLKECMNTSPCVVVRQCHKSESRCHMQRVLAGGCVLRRPGDVHYDEA